VLPQETRSNSIGFLSGVVMNLSTTAKQQVRQIQSKIKSQLTGSQHFLTDSAVIDYAIDKLYQDLKARRLI
jgi:hypothetical protein